MGKRRYLEPEHYRPKPAKRPLEDPSPGNELEAVRSLAMQGRKARAQRLVDKLDGESALMVCPTGTVMTMQTPQIDEPLAAEPSWSLMIEIPTFAGAVLAGEPIIRGRTLGPASLNELADCARLAELAVKEEFRTRAFAQIGAQLREWADAMSVGQAPINEQLSRDGIAKKVRRVAAVADTALAAATKRDSPAATPPEVGAEHGKVQEETSGNRGVSDGRRDEDSDARRRDDSEPGGLDHHRSEGREVSVQAGHLRGDVRAGGVSEPPLGVAAVAPVTPSEEAGKIRAANQPKLWRALEKLSEDDEDRMREAEKAALLEDMGRPAQPAAKAPGEQRRPCGLCGGTGQYNYRFGMWKKCVCQEPPAKERGEAGMLDDLGNVVIAPALWDALQSTIAAQQAELERAKARRDDYESRLQAEKERVGFLEGELEQREVQLAGCGAVALGWVPEIPLKPGDYGYSASLGEVLKIRRELEELRARVASEVQSAAESEVVHDPHPPTPFDCSDEELDVEERIASGSESGDDV